MAEDTAREALFPYCRRCIEHVDHWDAGSMTAAAITLLGIAAGALLGWSVGLVAGMLVFVLLAIVGHLVRAQIHARAATQCGRSCVSTKRAVEYYGWSGSTTTLCFTSPSYTARFAEHNSADLVSVAPALRRLLEANVEARRRVPTPAVAAVIPLSSSDPAAWIEHIERLPTRVLRRVAATRALALVTSQAERERIVAAACRWELAPFFERLEHTSRRQRRARIERFAEQVSADNLPPALVGAMLAQLGVEADACGGAKQGT
ncbi:MAG: hypothetical protein H0T46_02235 [Deltaproteobacteria bacterium]|nr:hypothetical protein [Deltaproteobacteria bacterium]